MTVSEEKVLINRWARRAPFNPGSSKQLLEYLHHRGYPIPKDRKTKKPSTSDESLSEIQRRLDEKDPILSGTQDVRAFTKAIGYLYDAMLGRDGRLHPVYTFIPKTGRLSAKRPNVMNLPQARGLHDIKAEAAEAIRHAIIPSSPDYLIAEFDWKAIEALLMAYFAEDPGFARLSLLDIHSYRAAFALAAEGKLPEPPDPAWPDDRLGAYLADVKERFQKVRYDFKKAGYSDAYGQGVFSLARDLSCTVEKAKWFKEMMRAASPKIAAWKDAVILRAHHDGRLTNPFGYTMSFFEALIIKDGKAFWGKEATECLAFPAQSTCASMLREVLVDLGMDPMEGDAYRLLVPTHDSVALEVRRDCFDQVMRRVRASMERPWEELGGLVVQAEGKFGESLRGEEMNHWSPAPASVPKGPSPAPKS